MNYLAQQDLQFGDLTGFGPLGENQGEGSINTFSSFVSSAIGLMTVVAIIWFVFVFFIGAIGIITAGGDKQALESARKKILSGIIGLVVVIAAIFIVKLIGFLIGIPNILNIGELFNQISGQ